MTAPAADLERRFYAFVADRALVWSGAGAAAGLMARLTGPDSSGPAIAVVALLVGAALAGALAVALGRTGTTPGHALAGVRVVAEGAGTPIGVPAALRRQLALEIAGLPSLGLGAVALAWSAAADPSRRRRAWHDHLVGSVVVDVPSEPRAQPEAGPQPGVVNLTALRLVPAPAEPRPPVAPRDAPSRPVPAPRARWRIGFDTGESLVVDDLVLVGRRPQPQAGEQPALLVPLSSKDMSLSKTHAQLQVAADGALVVMDRGSTNGSILIRRGVPRRLPPGRAATLVEDDRLLFGDREMRVARDP